ncbi:NAD(P)H-dependent oxidoreductase [Candidatus Sumerlaeota bacterium]|nr:NAD(P)H-dependent oxidoreductase [Candidatus Sumerlaeota bacterium]
MSFLVISTSLNRNSCSRIMARAARDRITGLGRDCGYIDLQDTPLPFCDVAGCYSDPNVRDVKRRIAAARGIIMAVPIYNYTISGAGKNLIELTGKAWQNRVVGFICAAGGKGSHMSIMSLANSLMLDFRTVIVPRFVYALEGDFGDDESISDPVISERIVELSDTVIRFADALLPSSS